MKKTIQLIFAAMILCGAIGLTACATAQQTGSNVGTAVGNTLADDAKNTANDLNNRALEKGKNALFNKLGL